MTKWIRRAGFCLVVLLLGGCAATVRKGAVDTVPGALPPDAAARLVLNVSGSDASIGARDWAGFKAEWRENFADKAAEAGIPFEMQEGPPRPTGERGTLLVVYVADYRFIRPGTRYLLGIMSGNAYIESKMTFQDLASGTTFASQKVDTSSSALQGVFSPMTNKQVEAIAVDTIRQIKPATVIRRP